MEIEKLRARLKNVHKKATEYNMTVKEAQSLLAEIDRLCEKPEVVLKDTKQVETPPKFIQRVFDGGGF